MIPIVNLRHLLMLFIVSIAPSINIKCSGYQVPLQGARQQGMAHFGGLHKDASSIYFNPAGMTRINKASLVLSVTPAFGYIRFRSADNGKIYDNIPSVETPFAAYCTMPLKNNKWSIGLGVYTPFGSDIKYEKDFPGRFIAQNAKVQTIYTQPTVAYKINEKLSFGMGIAICYGKVEIQRSLPITDTNFTESTISLVGSQLGAGYNLGLTYKISEQLDFGFSYRSRIKFNIDDGKAVFSFPNSIDDITPTETSFSSAVTLPDGMSGSLAINLNSSTIIGIQIDYTNWFVFEELRFDFPTPVLGTSSVVSNRRYFGAFAYRFAIEKEINKTFAIRAGAFFDHRAVQPSYVTPDVPDNHHFGVTGGLSITLMEKLHIDISMGIAESLKRTVANTQYNYYGTSKSRGFFPSLGIGYKF